MYAGNKIPSIETRVKSSGVATSGNDADYPGILPRMVKRRTSRSPSIYLRSRFYGFPKREVIKV